MNNPAKTASRVSRKRCRESGGESLPVRPSGSDNHVIHLDAHRGRIHLRMTALFMGPDLCVTLSGGDRPHIGAVALGQASLPPTVLTLPKHRETELARSLAAQLSSRLATTVCVACGIHLDNILEEEIREVLEMSEELTRDLSNALEKVTRLQPK